MICTAAYAQNNPPKLQFEEADLVAMKNYIDNYDFSDLADSSTYAKGRQAMNHFIQEHLIMKRHLDRAAYIPSYSTYYYYATNFNTEYAKRVYEMNDDGTRKREVLNEGIYYGRLGKDNNFPYSRREYEKMGVNLEEVRGNGYLAPATLVSMNRQLLEEDYFKKADSLSRSAFQYLESTLICAETKPIDPSFIIVPEIEGDEEIKLGKPIKFQVHATWRGYDIDNIDLFVKTRGPCHTKEKQLTKLTTDENGNAEVEIIIGDKNIVVKHDVTKNSDFSEMTEMVQPVVCIDTAAMVGPSGLTHHQSQTSKVVYGEDHQEAFLAFDIDKVKNIEKEANKTGSRMLKDALKLSLGLGGDFKTESKESPLMMMRFPLEEGSQTFMFNLTDMDSMMFGFDQEAIVAAMSGDLLDPQKAMELMGRNDGCVVIPDPMRLMQSVQVGNLLMMGASGLKDGNGTISGKIILQKQLTEEELKELLPEIAE